MPAALTPSQDRAGPASPLAAFLLGRSDHPPDLETLRRFNLAGYAYANLPGHHPLKAALRSSFLAATVRHGLVKAQVLPLVRAWVEAGVEVLLFKGFALAEFEYAAAAERFYGDVDVLIHPEQAAVAIAVAIKLGWREAWSRRDSIARTKHEEAVLVSSGGEAQIDLHRYILSGRTQRNEHRRRFTALAWENSRERVWDGVTVRVLAPEDGILVGLVLNRCWSTDGWGLKPHDSLDLRLLQEKHSLTATDLRRRARELGCSKTLELFFTLCNPSAGRLALGPQPRSRRASLDLLVAWESGGHSLDPVLGPVRRLPAVAGYVARELPGLVRVLLVLRRVKHIDEVLAQVDRPVRQRPDRSLGRRERLEVGLRWGLVLLGRRRDACLPRSLALFAALRADGQSVRFVSGVRRIEGQLIGHAWVELGGRPVDGWGDESARQLYQVNVEYPRSLPESA